jgi:small subunit ribosomal protein S7
MARSRKIIKKREIQPDPLYGSRLVARFINGIMHSGQKDTATAVVYGAFDLIKAKGQEPVKVFESAINTVAPKMEVRPRRVGGASYQVPTEVRGDRRISLGIRWIVEAATKRSNKEFHTFSEKLAAEFLDVLAGTGDAIRKRNAVHKMAEANRAFSHMRW